MTGLVTLGQQPGTVAQFPVSIDYPAALALRQMAILHDELPKYLLAPEVSAILHYVPDLHRKMLLATLWNTGARINEALALGRSDFILQPPTRLYSWPTLNSGRKGLHVQPDVRLPAVRKTVWFPFPMCSMSASWR